ncbi:MAG: sigma-70 family RNA polymerase sigma factor [Prevotella sp.]|nr:sigma-70 family RNA polymerase sigma factor [Prevotella sp.]
MSQNQIEQLFRKHYARLRRLAYTMLHDEEESKDAVSDVFVRMMQTGTQPDEDKAEGYLSIAVRNRCRDVIAHQQIRQKVERLIPTDNTVWLSETTEQQRYSRLRHLVDTELTEQTRQVFLLRFDRRMKYEEIATALGISEKTVYKHLHQAITKLHEHFKDQEQ